MHHLYPPAHVDRRWLLALTGLLLLLFFLWLLSAEVATANKLAEKVWQLFYTRCISWRHLSLNLRLQGHKTAALTTKLTHRILHQQFKQIEVCLLCYSTSLVTDSSKKWTSYMILKIPWSWSYLTKIRILLLRTGGWGLSFFSKTHSLSVVRSLHWIFNTAGIYWAAHTMSFVFWMWR